MASPSPPPSAPDDDTNVVTTIVGAVLALVAAAGIGISMVAQRYALAYPQPQVPMVCCTLSRFWAWFVGLAMYGASNGLQAFSLTLGPLFLLGGIFTLLLVFALVFARLILNERITPPKVVGALTIVVGVATCVVATPSDSLLEYNGAEMEARLLSTVGSIYVALLLLALTGTTGAMVLFEMRYPTEEVMKVCGRWDSDLRGRRGTGGGDEEEGRLKEREERERGKRGKREGREREERGKREGEQETW